LPKRDSDRGRIPGEGRPTTNGRRRQGCDQVWIETDGTIYVGPQFVVAAVRKKLAAEESP
jgi:hypothetical protein